MQVEIRPLKSIRTAKYNPRRISESALESLKSSIERFGFVDPVIVNDRTGTLVGGHQRVRAAKELGLKEIPVVGVNLDEAEEKALNVALNKISGEWDLNLLRGVLEDVKSEGLDLALTGFSADEITSLLGSVPAFDYDVLEEDDHEEQIEALAAGTKKGMLVEFSNEDDYEEAMAIAKVLRAKNVDLGAVFLDGLRANVQ